MAIGSTILAPIVATSASAQDWELFHQFTRVDGFLSDRKPEPGDYFNWEIYDNRTAKYYSVFPIDIQYAGVAELLMVDVYSRDFQPIITVQDENSEIIHRGNNMPAQHDQAANAKLYHARMEYILDETRSEEGSHAELLITTWDTSQGSYAMEWSLWRPRGTAAAPDPAPNTGNLSDCNCQDPATGRRFEEPIWEYGKCDPANAIQWCN